jgi:hypothetical protein
LLSLWLSYIVATLYYTQKTGKSKMNTTKKWQYFVTEYVKANHATTRDNEMAKEITKITGMECTLESVRKIRQRLGLKKRAGRPVAGQTPNFTPKATPASNDLTTSES